MATGVVGPGGAVVGGRRTKTTFTFQEPTIATSEPQAVGLSAEQYEATLYDKEIPLWIGGKSLIGMRIIEGPIHLKIGEEWTVSGIAGAVVPANYANDTRSITAIRINGKEAWNDATGAILSGITFDGPTVDDGQAIRWNTGTLSQQPDALSIEAYGDEAFAYTPMVTLAFHNIQVDQFGGEVPFFSVMLEDSHFGDPDDGITWQEALETLAAYDGRGADVFEAIDVTGRMDALILGREQDFIEFLQDRLQSKPHWTIRTGSKLYVIEKGVYARDLVVDRAKFIQNGDKPFVATQASELEELRELRLSFIDANRDNEPSTVVASEDIDPVPGTAAFETDSIATPVVSTAVEMLEEVNFAFYWRKQAQETAEYIAKLAYLGIEPGDVHQIDTDARTYHHSVVDVVRSPDWTTEIKTEGFLTCAIEGLCIPVEESRSITFNDDIDLSSGSASVVHVDGAYAYAGGTAGTGTARIQRLTLADFSTIASLDLTGTRATGPIPAMASDDTYLYVYTYQEVRRIDLSTFTAAGTLDLAAALGLTVPEARIEADYGNRPVVHDGYLYLPNIWITSDPDGPAILRVDLTDFSTVEALSIRATYGQSLYTSDCWADETYVYYAVQGTGGAGAGFGVIRVDPSSFNVGALLYLDVNADSGHTWNASYAFGCAFCGYVFLGFKSNFNPPDGVGGGVLLRASTSLSSAEYLDIRKGGAWSEIDHSTIWSPTPGPAVRHKNWLAFPDQNDGAVFAFNPLSTNFSTQIYRAINHMNVSNPSIYSSHSWDAGIPSMASDDDNIYPINWGSYLGKFTLD